MPADLHPLDDVGLAPQTSAIGRGEVPDGAVQGSNDFDEDAYGGPCPPESEEHDYVRTVHALAQPLDLPDGASVDELENAMTDTIIATGRLTGRYARVNEGHRGATRAGSPARR